MSLFDTQDLTEITHPDYPGERLIACRNPVLAERRSAKRESLLAATEALLAKVAARAQAGTLAGADAIGVAVGKVVDKYKMAKHLRYRITDTTLGYQRNPDSIAAEAALDGVYVIRTPLPAHRLDPPGVVTAYKNLARVERDFRNIKVDDLDLRPIHHYLDDRVRAHVLICMLAQYLTWAPAPRPRPAHLHRRGTTRPATTPSPPPPDQHTPTPRPPARPTSTGTPYAASAASSIT